MNLNGVRENYYFYSGKTSEIIRQLGLAGVATVWLFHVPVGSNGTIPPDLVLPLKLIIVGLACDLLQYATAAISWGVFHRIKERKGAKESEDFKAPRQMNWLPLLFFVFKSVLIVWAYALILSYLSRVVIDA